LLYLTRVTASGRITTVMRYRRTAQNMQPICTHKISIQSSKSSHAYPIIRLPREFRRLAGAAATIYETTYHGALAFLVVPCRKRKNGLKSDLDTDIENTSLYAAKVGRSNRLEPICFCFCEGNRLRLKEEAISVR
jgi:hypothetical protein